jgi:uncharacterized protein (DUF2235 family)
MNKIAAFLDGTWDSMYASARKREKAQRKGEPSDAADTNVVKLYEACDENRVQKRYFSGVGGLSQEAAESGSDSSVKARITGLKESVLGGAFGKGIADQIRKAYAFLSDAYQPGDSVYLFGFSRGAYAARSLAGFVDKVGLLLKGKEHFVEEAFWLYQKSFTGRESHLRNYLREVTGRPGLSGESDDKDEALPIYFIGVFDTVASLGLPEKFHLDLVTRPFNAYHRVEVPPNVTHARHALALHELRGVFRPVLWHRCSRPAGQTLVQMLFRGAHADVGGGYAQSYWSDHALRWMHAEAEAKQLPFHRPHQYPPPMPVALMPLPPIHCESIHKFWRKTGTYNRIGEFNAPTEPLSIHQSAMHPDFSHAPDLWWKARHHVLAMQGWLGGARHRPGWMVL